MSQLFYIFVCSRDAIEHWADALVVGDETAQEDAQARMPLVVTIKSVGDTEFNILASCIAAEHFDVVKAVGEIDLVRAITDEKDRGSRRFRRPAIQAVSGMQTSDRSVLNPGSSARLTSTVTGSGASDT